MVIFETILVPVPVSSTSTYITTVYLNMDLKNNDKAYYLQEIQKHLCLFCGYNHSNISHYKAWNQDI